MYCEKKLRAAIIATGQTPRKICKSIKMPERTFYRKMKSGKWGIDEANAISDAAGFDTATRCEIFL